MKDSMSCHALGSPLTYRRLLNLALEAGRALAQVRVANKQALKHASDGIEQGLSAVWPS